MSGQGPNDPEDRGFKRPWEADSDTDLTEKPSNVVPLPGLEEPERDSELEIEAPDGASDEGTDEAPGDVVALADQVVADSESGDSESEDSDEMDWESMAEGSTPLDDFTSEEYLTATTQEYQSLAAEVTKASEAEWEQQAVAATVPGVESGLVGFEDVGGGATRSEESYEAVEQAAASDLTMRIASALVIFGLFVGSLLLGGWWFSAFVILVMIVAVGEFYATVRTLDYRPLALFGLLGVTLMGVGAHNWGPTAIGGWAAIVIGATVLFFAITPRRNPLENASLTVLGMAWVGMLAFAIPISAGPHPIAYIMFLVLLIALNDIGAYFVGKAFGRRKLAPVVSPAKTVEGLIGGLIVAAIAASVLVTFPAWETIGLAKGLVAALVVGIFAPLGDLAESMVKRSIDVKDMGSVLPGHGGMLDRIDGFLFAVPAVYILFRGFGLL